MQPVSWKPSNVTFQASSVCVDFTKNLFSFNLSIKTTGMYVLKLTIISNDTNDSIINALSNNVRIVSATTSNTVFYNNFQLTFDGTFVKSRRAIYIAEIYNYYLSNYNIELVGPLQCIAGSIMFSGGVDLSNPATTQLLLSSYSNNSNIILHGSYLTSFTLGVTQLNITSTPTQFTVVTTTLPPITPVVNRCLRRRRRQNV
jgi:hypothetical protein